MEKFPTEIKVRINTKWAEKYMKSLLKKIGKAQVWTQKKPTKPGWYWYYLVGRHYGVVQVLANTFNDFLSFKKYDENEHFEIFWVRKIDGKWAGPIPKPVDPI